MQIQLDLISLLRNTSSDTWLGHRNLPSVSVHPLPMFLLPCTVLCRMLVALTPTGLLMLQIRRVSLDTHSSLRDHSFLGQRLSKNLLLFLQLKRVLCIDTCVQGSSLAPSVPQLHELSYSSPFPYTL